MSILENPISKAELHAIALRSFGTMVKAVVDVEKEIISVDAELHADLEAELLDHGSEQKNIWGINLYPELSGEDFIEFDSMINLRPSQGNRTRGVDDEKIRARIIKICSQWIQ